MESDVEGNTVPLGDPNHNVIPVDTPECQQCAACCFSELTRYVRVTGNDYARLGEAADSYVHFIENRAYLRITDGHCAALKFDMELGQFICQSMSIDPKSAVDYREVQRHAGANARQRANVR